MQTTKHAYEFLVRWDRDGHLSGAHAQFRFVTRDETGAVQGEFLGPAEPVAIAGAAGFPLADILSDMQAAALAELEDARNKRGSAPTQAAAEVG